MEAIADILIGYVAFILALTVHECAHAWIADKCGDPTARMMGRMTLNPLPHIDPVGTVLIPLLPSVMALFAGGAGGLLGFSLVGWGKPVPVNPRNFRGGSRDDVFVSVAGPLSNLATTLVALGLLRLLVLVNIPMLQESLESLLMMLAMISFCLAFFNMLPVPPLDGSHLLRYFLSFNGRQMLDQIGRMGFIPILILVNTPVWHLFSRAMWFLYSCLYTLFFF